LDSAQMIKKEPGADWRNQSLEGNAVSTPLRARIHREPTVPIGVEAACPKPAAAIRLRADFFPETLRQSLVAEDHDRTSVTGRRNHSRSASVQPSYASTSQRS